MKLILFVCLLLSSGCIVTNPGRFQLGGEFEFETTGWLQNVVGLKIRVMGGIVIERSKHDNAVSPENVCPLDYLLNPGGE